MNEGNPRPEVVSIGRPTPASDEDAKGTIVVRIETYALAVPIPLKRPPADSHASGTHWIVPVVEIQTKDGLIGTGISGIHTGAEILTSAIDNYYANELLGLPVADVREVWYRLYRSPLQWISRAGATHMAMAMIDIAVWDLAAKRSNLPLWRLLGGNHSKVRTYNTDVGWLNRSTDELVADCRDAVAAGWTRLKLKVGKPDWREDVARLTAVRKAVDANIDLMVDANKTWDLTTAMRIAPHLIELGIVFLEEPLHPDDVRGHQVLQRAWPGLPIALGESLYSRYQFDQFLRAEAVQVVQPDVTRLGITEYLEVASEALAAGIPVVPHAGDMTQVHQHMAAASFAPHEPLTEHLTWTREAFDQPTDATPDGILPSRFPGASTTIRSGAREKWGIPGTGSVRTS